MRAAEADCQLAFRGNFSVAGSNDGARSNIHVRQAHCAQCCEVLQMFTVANVREEMIALHHFVRVAYVAKWTR